MRRFIVGMVAGVHLAFGAAADPAEYRPIIDSQITAFLADDFATAFTFATPSLRQYFGTPQNFGLMVTQGYPMVWRPAEVSYLDFREEGGVFRQRVQIIDQAGALHILEYRMLRAEGSWRIGGVRILDAADFAA